MVMRRLAPRLSCREAAAPDGRGAGVSAEQPAVVRSPCGDDHMPVRHTGVPPEVEEISDRAPPGGGAAPPLASPPREAGKVRRSYLRSSWVPRKGSGFPSPASSLRPLTGSGGGELDGLVP